MNDIFLNWKKITWWSSTWEPFGAKAKATPCTSVPDAFGGLASGVAYSLHKGLEPMMIGASYSVYSRGRTKTESGTLRHVHPQLGLHDPVSSRRSHGLLRAWNRHISIHVAGAGEAAIQFRNSWFLWVVQDRSQLGSQFPGHLRDSPPTHMRGR